MSELLPCPFCGGEAGKIADATRILGTFNLIHRCPVIGPVKIEYATQEAVIATWNTRAPSQAQIDAARIETLTAELDKWREAHGQACTHWLDQVRYEISKTEAAEVDKARLWAALEDIADGCGETELVEIGRYAPVVARAAITGKETE